MSTQSMIMCVRLAARNTPISAAIIPAGIRFLRQGLVSRTHAPSKKGIVMTIVPAYA